MDRNLQNKTVVVTGGAAGIGYAIVENFIKKNTKVVIILDIDEKTGEEVAKKLTAKYGENRAVFRKCDVTTDLDATYEWIVDNFKAVDVLVNNAGILNERSMRKAISINATAVVEWSVKFFEHMRKDRSGEGGTIINVASIYGYRVTPFAPVYHATKFAVLGFSKSLGHEYNYSKFGVRVMVVCPGYTETTLINGFNLMFKEVEQDLNNFFKEQHWQDADSVGKAVVDVFESADSGTAWLVEDDKPVSQLL